MINNLNFNLFIYSKFFILSIYYKKMPGRKKSRKTGKSLSKKVSKLTKKVNEIIGSTETKTHEYAVHYNVSTAEQELWLVDQIQQGTGVGQRIGDEICLKSCSLNMRVGIDPTSVSPDSINDVRIMLIKTQFVQGVTLDAFLEDDSTGNFMISPYKINPPFKYKIIFDKKFHNLGYQLAESGDATYPTKTVARQHYRNININLKDHIQKYETGSPDLREESYLLILKSDSSVISHPRVDIYVRVRYQDL